MALPVSILCSTGAFSRDPDFTDYQASVRYAPELDTPGFELMFYPDWYSKIEQIGDTLNRSGLRFPAMHGEKSIGTLLGQASANERQRGVQHLIENLRLGQKLQTHVLVLHLWNWPEMDDHLEHNFAELERCYDEAEKYGIELALESIPGRNYDPLTNLKKALDKEPRCHFALDTEFLANNQQIKMIFETPWLWQEGRVHHIHIKDADGIPFVNGRRRYLHPGQGKIDFTYFFHHLGQVDFHGNLSLESPAIDANGRVNTRQLNDSLHFIQNYVQQ